MNSIDIFLSTPLCLGPFQLAHRFYGIQRELVDKTPITECVPLYFLPCLGLTPLTKHLNNTSSIAEHLKTQKENIPAQKLSFFPKIQQYQNNKITKKKNWKFSKSSISERNNLNSKESISNPVVMFLNLFSYCCYF